MTMTESWILSVQEKKEWREAQGGKLTKEQTIEIRMAKVNAGAKLGNATSDVIHEQIEAEERAMNEYLKEYGSYLEKRQAITELYNEKIAKATTEGERLSLAEGMKKDLADVDNEAQKSTSIITRLFDDMSKKNITSIRAIADEAEKILVFFLKEGNIHLIIHSVLPKNSLMSFAKITGSVEGHQG